MIFVFISIAVPLFIYFLLPGLLETFTGKPAASRLPLLIAGFLFFIAWYLPSPLIQGEFTAFNTHFVGGGLFTGFLWLYIKRHMGWKHSPFQDLLGLYFLVSALGAANELFEFSLTEFTQIKLTPTDTWWDLLANTLGILLFWVLYYIYSSLSNYYNNKT